MSGSFGLAFFVAATCGQLIILLTVVVDAQSTESESVSCETSSLDEAVNVIREELKDVRLIRGDLKDVKSACASRQQQPSVVDTTSLCEYRTRILSPPGIAMPPTGLCFSDVAFLFKCRPSRSTTGGTRIDALTPSMKKKYYG